MHRSKFKLFALSLTLAASALAHAAGTVAKDTDNDTVWQAGVDGVEIEWAPDGGFKRIYSAFYQPVRFADRSGISKAQIIAEEKAKAGIIRFMDQQVTSKRVLEQVDSDMETAARDQSSANGESWSKENRRKMVETLTEVTTSYSAGRLRGVIVLEKGYDEKNGEAWVKVGISNKTMGAAQALGAAINQPSGPAGPNGGTSLATMSQPSEVRRSNQKDW